ncbi:MAG: winged helix-turn-helix domain-containing protein [Gammaproteobacteria bacterium]
MNQFPDDALDVDSEIYVVGDLRVDIGQQRVLRSDTEIILPNLSFQLLATLIRGAPNVLSQDVLMERVWPGLVVSPETLSKRANLLREALGDDAKEPRYISLVRRRGYRLVADVTRAKRLAVPLEAPAPNAVAATPRIESSVPGTTTSDTRNLPTKLSSIRWLGLSAFLVLVLAVGIVARTIIKDHRSSTPIPTEMPRGANTPIGSRARTVAVLPFENISADAADAYLARGLPEMVLNRLSRVTGLAVIARNSSFALNTANIDSQEIGRRLNSGYLVNGSVQRKADRLRVSVQLVDTAAGTLIWSANFDRALRDIFTVEDEIADQVTGALSARLGALEPRPVVHQRSSNIEAYLAYLRGRTLLGRFTVAESDSAVPYFEKAIALDPNFAAAYASLYDARLQAADLRHEDLAPFRQRFRPLIDRALALDPNSGSAYFARAMWGDAPYEARIADFARGAALDPSNGRGLTAYATFLIWADGLRPEDAARIQLRPEEGARILQRALKIDPMSPRAHFDAAMTGEDGAAMVEQNMLSVLELDPAFVPALHQIGLYRWLFHDKLAEAAQILEHAIALDPGNPGLRHTAMAVYLDLGDERAARAVAAGTPQSARAVTLLSLYAGNWREAGRAAYDDVRWGDDCQNWLEPEALRDSALKTGELSRAIEFIKAKYYLTIDPVSNLDVCNNGAAIVLSQLMAAQGHAAEAQALRHSAMSWNVANAVKYAGGLPRIAAGSLLLDGRRDAALDKLAEDFRSGDYRFWWYTFKYDPVWLPLHNDPRFQAIAINVQRYVDAQRRALEELRRQGNIPDARSRDDSARKLEIK